MSKAEDTRSTKERATPQPARLRLLADTADQGARLDRFLAARVGALSRSRLQALIRAGAVRSAAGTLVDPGYKVKPGETIEVDVPEPEPAGPVAQAIALAVVFEDPHLIVVDKPAGLVVHPAAGHADGTLVNALIAHCGDSLSGIAGVKRPGIVHRLDKDTSGLLVVAKSDAAHRGLAAQFAAHGADGRMSRRYTCFVWGALPHLRGRIDAALARSTSNRTKIAVVSGGRGRHAVTRYAVDEVYRDDAGKPVVSRLTCELETGRTHQIRVHLAHAGHPLLADAVYGSHFAASAQKLAPGPRTALEALGRQALHAAHLGFEHPVTGRRMAFDSPLPADLAALHLALARVAPNAPKGPARRRPLTSRRG